MTTTGPDPDVVVLDLGGTTDAPAPHPESPASVLSRGRVALLVAVVVALVVAAPQPRAVLAPGDLVVEIDSLAAAPASADTLGTADVSAHVRSTTWFGVQLGVGGQVLDLPPAGAAAVVLHLDPDCARTLTVPVSAAASGGPSAFAVAVADPADLPALCPRPVDGAAVTVTGAVRRDDGARLRIVNHGSTEAIVTAASSVPESGPADACCGMTLGDYLDLSRRAPVVASPGLPALLAPGQAVELDLVPGQDPCTVAAAGSLLEVRTQSDVTPVRGQALVAADLAAAAARDCAALP